MESSQPSPAIVGDHVDLDALKALRVPFEGSAVGKLPRGENKERPKQNCQVCGGYHHPVAVHLDFVGHANVTDRLLTVDPTWTWEPVAWENGRPALEYDKGGSPVGLWIWLYAGGIRRLGYGSCASNKSDAVKELIGDALRNAGVRFGVALELWAKGDLESAQHDDVDDAPKGTAGKPEAADTGTVKAASKRDRDAIVALLNTLPEKADDAFPRAHAKQQYVELFGKPAQLPADKVVEAKEWAAEQAAQYAPVGSPVASEDGAGSDTTPDPAPSAPVADPANLRIGIDAYLGMLAPDEKAAYEAWRAEKFLTTVELDAMDADDLQATWEWLAHTVEPYNDEEQT